jgi:DNA-binding Lrp family transcriptional regulator
MIATDPPTNLSDPINAAILRISEDGLNGFQEDPFGRISEQCNLPVETVISRVRAMLLTGTIRRVRQTLQSTRLATGALVAWRVPLAKLDTAFDFMSRNDPFSGHVVLRSTDPDSPGHDYRLWTTLKVPQGFSLTRHCEYLRVRTGADAFKAMPARRLFVLGVGHLRRRTLQPGDRTAEPAEALSTEAAELTPGQWDVLSALKREFMPAEIARDLWTARAREAGVPSNDFIEIARRLDSMGLIGRFSTFLEHVKPLSTGERVTRYNALFHWAVPAGREIEAGCEIGRHRILTHAYWRVGGPEFGNVNLMAVAHGLDRQRLLDHKCAIDMHLASSGIPVSYTNVFWGGRSEIKPSEVIPSAYVAWCERENIDPASMREET